MRFNKKEKGEMQMLFRMFHGLERLTLRTVLKDSPLKARQDKEKTDPP